ncbi:5'/3'-nucleotidase SurE [Mariniblastus sp.]|nr:5'/3'-nucleotidase SurE [Mariniblastus sp.]
MTFKDGIYSTNVQPASLENMNILVTNDDGWDAPGIDQLTRVAAQFGSVTVIAPAGPQSGISHQLTMGRAMELVEQKPTWYSLAGTPADCVRFGLHHLDQKFDLVLSGINHGANLGVDVFTSGTVAAAREANFHGVNAIAFSQYRNSMGSDNFDWNRSADWTTLTLDHLFKFNAGSTEKTTPTLFNVNLPDPISEKSAVPDIVHCETDLSPLPIDYKQTDGLVQFSGTYQDRTRTADQDVEVCFGGRISVSQL